MRRLIGSCLVLGLVVLAAPADDEKGKKEEKPATPQAIFQELVTKFRGVKSKDEQQELFKTYGEKLIECAKKNATNDTGIDALFMVFQIPGKSDKDTPRAKAIEILNKDHVKNAKLGAKLKRLPASPEDAGAMGFLTAVVKENPDKTTKAYAARAIIKANEQAKQVAERLKGNEAFKKQMETASGKETVEKVLAAAEKADKVIDEYKAKLQGDLKGVFADLSVGVNAPEVESKDLDGKPTKLSQYKGKVVVLDIWATWCGPCVAMIPHTTKLVEKLKDKPFVFISISADAKAETVQDFMKKTAMPWTHWYEGQAGKMISDWEVEYFPTIYILDHKGTIRFKDLRGEKMDEAIEKLIKEAEDAKKAKTE